MDNPINNAKYKRFLIISSILSILGLGCFFLFFRGKEYLLAMFSVVLLLPIFVFAKFNEVNRFNLELTGIGIIIYQSGEKPFTIPYSSITRIYLHKTPIDKIRKVTNLIIEFGEKHDLKDRIFYWGPKSVLNSLYSPGIWGNYCAIPDIDDLKAEELKNRILSYTGNNVEVKRIGLLYI